MIRVSSELKCCLTHLIERPLAMNLTEHVDRPAQVCSQVVYNFLHSQTLSVYLDLKALAAHEADDTVGPVPQQVTRLVKPPFHTGGEA